MVVQSWVSTACRVLLGVVFAWAGLAKVSNPDAAVRAVRAYKILPEGLVKLFAWGLPAVEIALAALLILGISVRLSALIAGGLIVVFIGAISSAWARGLQIDCGCFGGGGAAQVSAMTFLTEIGRDVGLLAAASWLAWWPDSRLALAPAVAGDDRYEDMGDDGRYPEPPGYTERAS